MADPLRGGRAAPEKTTPAMAQYRSIKEQHRDAILFFHIGDFYETFGEDAETISRELDIALTSRSKDSSGKKIPLAGVPCHAAEGYISRLIAKGYRVAVCDQVEDAHRAKGIVKREVVRVITPGTVIDEGMFTSPEACYLMAIAADEESPDLGLAFLDVSTGQFLATSCSRDRGTGDLLSEIRRYQPAECLLPPDLAADLGGPVQECGVVVTEVGTCPGPDEAAALLEEQFGAEGTEGDDIGGSPAAVRAAALALRYAKETQRKELSHVRKLSFRQMSGWCVIDGITQRNLEITRSIRGRSGDPTLLSVLNLTGTPMGSRLLRQWLAAPLLSADHINDRLDAVEFFAGDTPARLKIRTLLAKTADIERIAGRIAYRNASPRDLISLARSLEAVPALCDVMSGSSLPRLLAGAIDDLGDPDPVVSLITRAITEDPPVSVRNGGIFREGYDARLDSLRSRSSRGREWIIALQQQERERTGIRSLKVAFNSVFGYYIEVTRPNLHLVPPEYERKQTTSTGERFTLPELKEQEAAIATAEEGLCALEQELFSGLLDRLAAGMPLLQAISRGMAALDIFSSLAEAAVRYRYTRPVLDTSGDILIREGRHPVVERAEGVSFVPNDTTLSADGEQILIITGANMAGKSTYMRAVAHIVIMAQAGSFVPATHARIGLVDRIFTRVGAFDDLASGQSTFMVEMLELANILNNVSGTSLVILDEIGRGTSTLDGYCIARAVLEFLHGKRQAGPRTLFATHFHEIVTAESDLKRVRNYHFAVRDTGSEVVFLRTLIPGATDRSYGIHVATLAGVPSRVTDRAAAILDELMRGETGAGGRVKRYTQMLLIEAPQARPDPLIADLRDLDPDSMSPRQALEVLYELHRKAGGRKGVDR
ncbi:MAG: DNA mismatch repair protein MutS [Methanomicrobiales archaeon]|nr:DNA mismatch repair protein MutS [Methanomicrobiales archaeon]NYT20211.1 DNA mismatch repair protein MutS [Methanomicrobiales archaeon]